MLDLFRNCASVIGERARKLVSPFQDCICFQDTCKFFFWSCAFIVNGLPLSPVPPVETPREALRHNTLNEYITHVLVPQSLLLRRIDITRLALKYIDIYLRHFRRQSCPPLRSTQSSEREIRPPGAALRSILGPLESCHRSPPDKKAYNQPDLADMSPREPLFYPRTIPKGC